MDKGEILIVIWILVTIIFHSIDIYQTGKRIKIIESYIFEEGKLK